jgi:hypothetical protein
MRIDHTYWHFYEALRNQSIINISFLLNSACMTSYVDINWSYLCGYPLFIPNTSNWLETLGFLRTATKSSMQEEHPKLTLFFSTPPYLYKVADIRATLPFTELQWGDYSPGCCSQARSKGRKTSDYRVMKAPFPGAFPCLVWARKSRWCTSSDHLFPS